MSNIRTPRSGGGGGAGETSPKAIPGVPQAMTTINTTLMRHTSSTGSMFGKSPKNNNDLLKISS
jgi:hypothetical protein